MGVRQQLPGAVVSQLEQTVSGRGNFKVVVTDPPADQLAQGSKTSYQVTMKGRTYEAYPYGRRTHNIGLDGLSLHGVATTDAQGQPIMAISSDPVRVLDAAEVRDVVANRPVAVQHYCPVDGRTGGQVYGQLGQEVYVFCDAADASQYNDAVSAIENTTTVATQARLANVVRAKSSRKDTPPDQLPPSNPSGSQGVKHLLMLPVLFPDDPRPPVSMDGIWGECAYNNQYYEDGSYGTFSWISTVTPYLTLRYPKYLYGEGSQVRNGSASIVGDAYTAAQALGYQDGADDLYTVFTSMPQYTFGGRSDGLLNGGVGALPHELGHSTLGVIHANFWDTTVPSTGPTQPSGQNYPIDIESTVGHDDVNAPFDAKMDKEYGCIYDVMGSGGGHFGVYFKNMFNWLPDAFVRVVTNSCTNRVYTFDTPSITDGRTYALRMRKNIDRDYWASFRTGFADNAWEANGIELNWGDGGNYLLLDTTPGSPWGKVDSAVVVGRTYADEPANLYLTPIAKGADSPSSSDQWLDVVVQVGPFPTNVPPTVSLSAAGAVNRGTLVVSNGAQVDFVAMAQDANGDTLAYHWEFGDGSFSITNRPTCSKVFSADGQYVVRCEVSDMRGGVASAWMVVVVGSPVTRMMFGRITDDDGNPLQGIRVHNCGTFPQYVPTNPESGASGHTNSGSYRMAYTDSDGYYAIGNLDAGVWQNRAFQLGFRDEPMFDNPVDVSASDAFGLDHTLHRLPRVSIAVLTNAIEGNLLANYVQNANYLTNDDGSYQMTNLLVAVAGADGTAAVTNVFFGSVVNSDASVSYVTVGVTNPDPVLNLANVTVSASNDTHGVVVYGVDLGLDQISVNVTLVNADITVTTNFVLTNFQTGVIEVTRQCSYDDLGKDLTVFLEPGGVAVAGTDYLPLPQTIFIYEEVINKGNNKFQTNYTSFTNYTVTIPAWQTSAQLEVMPTNNGVGGGALSLVLDLAYAPYDPQLSTVWTNIMVTNPITGGSNLQTVLLTITNLVLIPGYQLMNVGTGPNVSNVFFQSMPTYVYAPQEAVLQIADSDPPGVPAVSVYGLTTTTDSLGSAHKAGDVAAVETRGDTATAVFVRAGAPLDQPLVVYYRVSGDASNGWDYVYLPGQLTIPAGQNSAELVITAINDLRVEGNEVLQIRVLPDPHNSDTVTNYTIAGGRAQFVLVDDDLPTVWLTAVNSVADRGGLYSSTDGGAIRFTRTGTLDQPLKINYLAGGTATAGVDYQQLPGSVTIPAGQVTADVAIQPIHGSSNLLKTVTLVLSDSTTYNQDPQNSATVTIRQTLPAVTVTAVSASVAEGGAATGGFVFTLPSALTNSLRVYYAIGGTAIMGDEYSSFNPNYVDIPAGATSVTNSFNPRDNASREHGDITGDPFVLVQLLPGSNYNVLDSGSNAKVSIAEKSDDTALPAVGFMTSDTYVREDAGVAYIPMQVSANPNTSRNWVTGDITNDTWLDSPVAVLINLRTNNIRVEVRPISGTAAVGVNYSTNPPTYTNMVDYIHYTPPNPPIAHEAHEDSIYMFAVPIVDDGVPAGDKTVTFRIFSHFEWVTNFAYVTNQVTVTNPPASTNVMLITNVTTITNISPAPTNQILGSYNTHTIHIQDVDSNVVSLAADTGYSYERGQTPVHLTVSRTGPLTKALTVYYGVGGTAAPGSDYVALSTNHIGAITIPAGTNQVSFTFVPKDDFTEETAEYVTLSVLARPGYTVGAGYAEILIVSDDGTIQFGRSTYPEDESVGQAVIDVVRSGDTNRAVSVDYLILNGTATNGVDFRATNGTVLFNPGETIKSFTVTIVDNTLVQTTRTALLYLTNATGGVPLGGQNAATLAILDNDVGFQFSTNTFAMAENGGAVLVSIDRFGMITNEASVIFATVDGSARAGTNYLGTNQVLTFAAGQTNQVISIPILDDAVIQGNQTAQLVLSGPTPTNAASVGAISNATLLILDDDCALQFSAQHYFVHEYEPYVTVTVLRKGGSVNPVSVDFFTQSSTGLGGGTNYYDNAGTLTFAGDAYVLSTNGDGTYVFIPGETNKTFTVNLVDNGLGDGNKDFLVNLTNAQTLVAAALNSAVVAWPTQAIVTMIDAETPGAVDYGYNSGPGPNDRVWALALQPYQSDRAVVFGGDFTTVDGYTYRRIARLQPNGVLDPSFNPGFGVDATVFAVAIDASGKILIGGAFSQVNNTNRVRIARLNADGSLDRTFYAGLTGANGTVRAIAVQTDGRILIGGDFTTVNTQLRGRLARLNPDGSLDGTFTPSFSDSVSTLALQADGGILVGGQFSTVNGTNRPNLARLLANGQLDAAFLPSNGPNARVSSVLVQPDGRILLGGVFMSVGGSTAPRLARLNANGSVDSTFSVGSGPSAALSAVALHSSGRIIIAGDFTSYNGQTRARVARLRPTGALDSTFDPGLGPDNSVGALAVQPNSAVIIGGAFTNVNTLPRRYIARLHGDEVSSLVSVELASSSYSVLENSNAVVISINRTGGSTNVAFTVDYLTADVSAVAGVDYTNASGTLSFAPGELAKTITLGIVDNPLIESNKTFLLVLTNGSIGVDLGGLTKASILIIENQKAVRFGSSTYLAHENDGSVAIQILRLGNLDDTLSVIFKTADATGVAGSDYGAVTTNLVFGPGQSNQTVYVPLVDDLIPEPTKTVNLLLTNVSGGFLTDPSNAVLTILDHVPFGTFQYTNKALIQIIDAAPAAPYPSVISVTNLGGVVNQVIVTLDGVKHTFPSDIQALLVGPNGRTNVLLLANAGANYPVTGSVLTFDDTALVALPQAAPLASGSYRPGSYASASFFPLPAPAGPYGTVLSVFTGGDPRGDWKLYVQDVRGGDYGWVSNGWRLTLVTVDTNSAVDLAIGAQTSMSSVMAGQVLSHALFVTNVGALPASGVVISDVLPVNFTLLPGSPAVAGAGVTNGVLTIPLGTLNPLETRAVTFKGYSTSLTPLTNVARVSADQPDLNLGNNTAVTVVSVTPSTALDLTVAVDETPNPVLAGGMVVYSLRVTNDGPLSASGVLVTNQLPDATSFLAAYMTQGTYTKLGNMLVFSVGVLPPRSGAVITIQASADLPGAMTNRLAAGCDQADLNSANNSAEIVTTVLPAADVSVSTAVNTLANGSTYVFTLTVINHGPMPATGVTLFDAFPNVLSLISASGSQGSNSLSGGILTFQFGSLASGARATATIQARQLAGGVFTNWATVIANEPDANLANNTTTYASSSGTLTPQVDLVVQLIGSPNPVLLGSNLFWTVTVTNQGPSNAVNVVLTSQFSSGMVLLDATATQGACRITNGSVIGHLGDLAVGSQATVVILSYPTLGVPASSTASVTSDYPDRAPANNTASAQVNVILPSPLANPSVIAILDAAPAAPYPSTITLSNYTGVISKVTITLTGFQHTFPSDVNALLVDPSGQKSLLMSHVGDRFSVTNLVLAFDDAATNALSTNALASGTYQPSAFGAAPVFIVPAPAGPYPASLGALQGGNPNGVWQLFVNDDHGGDAGLITGGWSLTVDTAAAVLPVLSIALEGTQAVISWPASVAGFTLEYTAIGGVPTNWGPAGAPTLNNGRYEVRRNLPGVGEMYRLRQ